ncbi:MAG TPA: hypothetical protein VFS43_18605 [Polyangiaceae bacterium]|nr:hypothetical protein [Polyangiaceae bacterium]
MSENERAGWERWGDGWRLELANGAVLLRPSADGGFVSLKVAGDLSGGSTATMSARAFAALQRLPVLGGEAPAPAGGEIAPPGEPRSWHAVGDGAFAPPFGTVRSCRGCGCLVVGGPTACGRCAADEALPDEKALGAAVDRLKERGLVDAFLERVEAERAKRGEGGERG